MMDDLISRQHAIDKLECVGYDFSESGLSNPELEEVCEAVGEVREDMIKRIRRLPSAQQWIPCSERLPDEYVSVLCYQPVLYGSNMWIGHLNSDGNWVDSDGWEKLTNPVTAWMPLPKPYEGMKMDEERV